MQTGYREAGPVGSEALAPRWSAFANGQMPWGYVAFDDLKYNADGSIDLYVGPKALAGHEANHIKTVGEDGWFEYFRLFAPLQPFFDKTSSPRDFQVVP